MTTLRKWQLLILANAVSFNACSNPNANNNQANVSNPDQPKTGTSQQITTKSSATVQTELDKAKKAGKAVFLVVSETTTKETDQATAIAKDANKTYKNAVIIQMKRDDAANAQLVDQFRLTGAPMPLILVISPKGYPTGGYILAEANAQNVAKLVPSPKLDMVYESLNGGKPVFIVVSKKSNIDKTKTLEVCKSAKSQVASGVSIIEIDAADKKEEGLINQLKINTSTNATTVVVLNASGQTTGTFEGNAETSSLVASATKVIRSGCCPGGSGSCKPKQ